jgi:hypothetical protein
MVKVSVELEIDITKVGYGWFYRRLQELIGFHDEYIRVTKINCPDNWKNQ